MKTLRASEIGAFVYCQRAWHYRRQGFAPDNPQEMAAGTRLHQQHGRSVLLSGCLRALAFALLLLALALVAAYLTRLVV